ncbi:G-patch domain and KOW motifs-containing protein isoform X1 [Ranitomeya imitator]|uniref:G-patch domain and KOW motifs-containing protein isoform X1 n=1 Tax=Ranitomeya imitator TaxID=111125 RepID=UPI0037E71A3C
MLQKKWVCRAYHSTFSNYARGVSVLIHTSTPFEEIEVKTDKDGQYVLLVCKIFNRLICIVSLYIPPPYSGKKIQEILEHMRGWVRVPLLVVGDVNNIADDHWDKSNHAPLRRDGNGTPFGNYLREIGWIDLWRVRNVNTYSYSCYSTTYGSMSRIDVALGNDGMNELLSGVEYSPRILSDHSPVQVSLKLSEEVGSRKMGWKVHPSWLQLLDMERVGAEIEEFFKINDGSAECHVVWDTMKAYLRGILFWDISRHKTRTRVQDQAVLEELKAAEAALGAHCTRESQSRMRKAQQEVNQLYLRKAERLRDFQRASFYSEGEKVGYLLSVVASAQRHSSHVYSIKTEDGTLVTQGEQILEVFRKFYDKLYTSSVERGAEDMTGYLEGIDLPRLSREECEVLEEPIGEEELGAALVGVAGGKAPGADGIPAEVYKVLKETLLAKLSEVYNSSLERGELPLSMREAIVVVIPKADKDPQLPESYRPISLLTADIKILANRLSRVIDRLIHPDQSGFMPNKSTALNLRRLFLNLQIPSDNVGKRVVVSLDAHKAFNCVEWSYLWSVLE